MNASASVVVIAGCGSVDNTAQRQALQALDNPHPAADTPAPSTKVAPGCSDEKDALRSFAPASAAPDPTTIPGPVMSRVRTAQTLRVGVDDNTLGFGVRDPVTGELTGIEVELARGITRALLGDENKVTLVTVVTEEKVAYAAQNKVDLTIDAVSMSCARWGEVDFTSEYFTAQHTLLVRADSPINGLEDVGGRRVCVTKGSSSVDLLAKRAPTAKPRLRAFRTDCVRALQQGRVDAFLSHDSILGSAVRQDPTLRIVDRPAQAQHYGIAVPKGNVELVRSLNALLEEWRRNGDLDRLDAATFGTAARPVPAAQYKDAAS